MKQIQTCVISARLSLTGMLSSPHLTQFTDNSPASASQPQPAVPLLKSMPLKGRCLTHRATQAPRVCLFLKSACISKCFTVNIVCGDVREQFGAGAPRAPGARAGGWPRLHPLPVVTSSLNALSSTAHCWTPLGTLNGGLLCQHVKPPSSGSQVCWGQVRWQHLIFT